jgi:D-aminopeptidase
VITQFLVFFLVGFILSINPAFALPADPRPGCQWCLPVWQYSPGPLNAITDVPGVAVGHVTLMHDKPDRVRTGVTAILPHQDNLATQAVFAAATVLNGNGEMTGLSTVEHTGLLNSPVVLTNTPNVGAAHTGVHQFMQQQYGNVWAGQLPVVAECWDGVYNTLTYPIPPAATIKALMQAKPGAVVIGPVGAGTGMRSFELHAGIGTASRVVALDDGSHAYTIGVLVNANHSRLKAMSPIVRQRLEATMGNLETKRLQDNADAVWNRQKTSRLVHQASRQGSIIVIIATNAPLLPSQLKQLANRAALGIAAMGSTMDTTSGDFALAFSTAQQIPVGEQPGQAGLVLPLQPVLHPDAISPLQRATVEAVTEAQMRALLATLDKPYTH